MMEVIKNKLGGQIRIDAPGAAGTRRLTVRGDEGGYACVDLTPEMLAALTAGLVSGERYFVDEIGGDFFMVPIEHRMDWYDYDTRVEETCEPEPIPSFARQIESLCHLEFAQPEEPFV